MSKPRNPIQQAIHDQRRAETIEALRGGVTLPALALRLGVCLKTAARLIHLAPGENQTVARTLRKIDQGRDGTYFLVDLS